MPPDKPRGAYHNDHGSQTNRLASRGENFFWSRGSRKARQPGSSNTAVNSSAVRNAITHPERRRPKESRGATEFSARFAFGPT